MWTRCSRRLVGYVLAIEVATVALTVASLLVLPIRRSDVTLGLTILGCALIYIEASAPVERIRERISGTPHINLNSTWTFAAAVLVHPAMLTLVVAVIFVYRWVRVRHRDVYRHTFSAAATILSSYAGMAVLAFGGHYRTFSEQPRTLASMLVVAAGGLVFVLVNTIMISGVIAMTQPNPTLRTITTSWGNYALELATVGLAILVAWALVDWPAALAVVFGVTLVLHGKVLIPQLREALRTDVGTGLLNRSAWITAAEQAFTRAQHAGYSVGILMVDLDHFKRINDQHGHQVGDDVLRFVAVAIASELRMSDLIGEPELAGRYGGEEFVVLLPATDEKGAMSVAERIRQQVAQLVLPTEEKFVTVTSSIGVAVYPSHGPVLKDVVKAADGAMYMAKGAGRNRIRLAPPPTD